MGARTDIKPGDPQGFYTLSDFYQFIKTPDNSPVSHTHNIVQLYPKTELDSIGNKVASSMLNDLFSLGNCRKFSLCVQEVEIPNISLGNSVPVNTPLGNWNTIDNVPLNTQSDSVGISFLETTIPIIELMIYPWLVGVLQTEPSALGAVGVGGNSGASDHFAYPFPRADMAVKFFSPYHIPTPAQVKDGKYPPISWIYYFDRYLSC
jgi:hypothetical protein